jgi:CRISPR-associated helicase Cas3
MVTLEVAEAVETSVQFFQREFKALRGYNPYPYQEQQFSSVLNGRPAELVYIPTGGGKTEIIAVWLLAVLYQVKTTGAVSIPRRLYYAVDRRSVVDQTELVAADLLEKINSNHRWFSLLSSQTASTQPLVVSVLRGQRVTEQEPIIKDPSAFAVVLCTPDMVLSRLLFSAYGCSPRVASREAGLVGQDAWIVLDEAHISDAGRQTLEYVKQHNTTNMRPWWYTCMTATPRNGSENKLTLSSDDLELMKDKLRAPKAVRIIDVPDKELVKNVLDTVEQLPEWKRLIVYVEKPGHAAQVCRALAKQYTVRLLTGTMRGFEKARLDLSAFKKAATVTGKHVLVCTAAGELGLDVSCDVMITEFTFIDRLLQRLGRLNRWNEVQDARGFILRTVQEEEDKDSPKQVALDATLAYLNSLPTVAGGIDVSNYTVYCNPTPQAAFSPTPRSSVLNEAILAQLVNTSVEHCIPASDYIRGREFQYHIDFVIRSKRELDAVVKMTEEDLQNYVSTTPVLNEEIFKEPLTSKLIAQLVEALGDRSILYVSAQGEPEVLPASALNFSYRSGLLYLPDDVQWIDAQGVFKIGGEGIGDIFSTIQSRYLRFIETEQGIAGIDNEVQADSRRELLKNIATEEGYKATVTFDAGSLLYVRIAEKKVKKMMLLNDHLAMAEHIAKDIVGALQLEPVLAAQVTAAMLHHDDGKSHPLWQLAALRHRRRRTLGKAEVLLRPETARGYAARAGISSG